MPFSNCFASFKHQSWPFLRRMLGLSLFGWLPCLAQNEVNQVTTILSSGRVTPGAEQTVKLTVKEVKRIDNGFTVIFQDGNGSLSTQTTSGITGLHWRPLCMITVQAAFTKSRSSWAVWRSNCAAAVLSVVW